MNIAHYIRTQAGLLDQPEEQDKKMFLLRLADFFDRRGITEPEVAVVALAGILHRVGWLALTSDEPHH